MEKEDVWKKFNNAVNYLHRNIPPDDIYLFAQQTFVSALYLLLKLKESINIEEECESNETLQKIVTNIMYFHTHQQNDIKIEINLNHNEDE